jgi:hypothetical protein
VTAVQLRVDVDAEALLAKLGVAAGPRLVAEMRAGLGEGLMLAAGEVQVEAGSKGIQSRTGNLLGTIAGKLDPGEQASGRVGVFDDSPAVKYAYLLGDEDKHILPVNAKALTIPIDGNLTGAGVATYANVAALKAVFGDKVHRHGGVIGVGNDPDFIPYFALVSDVWVHGRDVLEPGTEKAVPAMVETVQGRVDRLLGPP